MRKMKDIFNVIGKSLKNIMNRYTRAMEVFGNSIANVGGFVEV